MLHIERFLQDPAGAGRAENTCEYPLRPALGLGELANLRRLLTVGNTVERSATYCTDVLRRLLPAIVRDYATARRPAADSPILPRGVSITPYRARMT